MLAKRAGPRALSRQCPRSFRRKWGSLEGGAVQKGPGDIDSNWIEFESRLHSAALPQHSPLHYPELYGVSETVLTLFTR